MWELPLEHRVQGPHNQQLHQQVQNHPEHTLLASAPCCPARCRPTGKGGTSTAVGESAPTPPGGERRGRASRPRFKSTEQEVKLIALSSLKIEEDCYPEAPVTSLP